MLLREEGDGFAAWRIHNAAGDICRDSTTRAVSFQPTPNTPLAACSQDQAGGPRRRHAWRCSPGRPDREVVAARGRSLRRADAQGRRTDRRHRHLPPGGPPVHRQADRAGHELRRPGRHRHRERPPAQRIARAHRRSGALGRRIAGARRGLAGGQLDARPRTGADHHRAARGAALAHRRRRDLRVRRGAAGVQAPRHLRHERGDDRRHHRPAHRHRRRPHRAGGDGAQADPGRRHRATSRRRRSTRSTCARASARC